MAVAVGTRDVECQARHYRRTRRHVDTESRRHAAHSWFQRVCPGGTTAPVSRFGGTSTIVRTLTPRSGEHTDQRRGSVLAAPRTCLFGGCRSEKTAQRMK